MRSGGSMLVKIAGLLGIALFPWIAINVYHYWIGQTLVWPAPEAPNLIRVTEATYGLNCDGVAVLPGQVNRLKQGNATAQIARICDNAIEDCTFIVDVRDLGDPAPGCAKDLRISWRCSRNDKGHRLRVAEEAHTKSVTLACGN